MFGLRVACLSRPFCVVCCVISQQLFCCRGMFFGVLVCFAKFVLFQQSRLYRHGAHGVQRCRIVTARKLESE